MGVSECGYSFSGMRCVQAGLWLRNGLFFVIPGRVGDANYDVQLHIGESMVPHQCWEEWIQSLRLAAHPGMTPVEHYNDSGAVASSSQAFVASSTWPRTAWRTRS
jgi:hypothetical protein